MINCNKDVYWITEEPREIDFVHNNHHNQNTIHDQQSKLGLTKASLKFPLEGAFISGNRLKEGSVYFIFSTIWGAFIGGRRLKEGGVHWRIYGIYISMTALLSSNMDIFLV